MTEQIGWVVTDCKVGVGIRDATLSAAAWQTSDIWNRLKSIRLKSATPTMRPVPLDENGIGGIDISRKSFSGIDMKITARVTGDAFARIYDGQGRQITAVKGMSNGNGS